MYHLTRNIQKKEGFTLIEMVVVVFLVGLCGVVLVNLYFGHNRLFRAEIAQLNITGDARASLDDIDSYVRQANRTLSSYSTYTAGVQVLILQIQSINSSNQLIPGTYDDVVYYLQSGQLFRRVFPNAASARAAVTKRIANNVTGLVFTYNDPDYPTVTQVKTDLTIQENAGIQTRSITTSSQARLRNH